LSEVRVARLQEPDLPVLLAGYATVFAHSPAPERAAWNYLRSPEGPAYLFGAWDGDDLVGGYVLLPRRFRFRDVSGLCFQRTDAWVLESHRRRGIYNRLVDLGMDAATRAGAAFLFGFPNEHPGAVQNRRGVVLEVPLRRRMALLRTPSLPGLRGLAFRVAALARRARALSAAAGYTVRALEAGDLDARLGEEPAPDRVTPVADAAFWRWRYLDPASGEHTVFGVDHEGEPALTAAVEWSHGTAYLLDVREGPDPAAATTALRLLLGAAKARGAARVEYESSAGDHTGLLASGRFLLHPRPGHVTVHAAPGFEPPPAAGGWSFFLRDRDVVNA